MTNNSSVFVQTLMYMMNQSIIQQESSYNYYYMQIGKDPGNATKCYGSYGCFELNYPWTSESRPVSLYPEELPKIEPNFPIYTRNNPEKAKYFDLNDFNYVEQIDFDATKPIFFVTHGYLEGGGIKWISNIVRALLDLLDCTVIVIDWHGGSSPPYTQAVANIRLVGAVTAHMLHDISAYTGPQGLSHVHLIGHSLGAHLSGYVGYTVQKMFNLTIGRITALDPAEPHFSKTEPPVRLDRTAAQYVDVIHTDASQFIRGGLGMTESIGHVDYYPNGGTNQPGCTKGVHQFVNEANGNFFNGFKKYLSCNHIRAHEFFLESIKPNPRCKFMTLSCPSYQDFISGNCFGCGDNKEKCLPFGFHGRKYYEKFFGHKHRHTSKVQYLTTGEDSPFCRGHYRIIVQVSKSNESETHGGEIGQLIFRMHSTSDGKGFKSNPVGFLSGFHQPGRIYMGVVAADEVPELKAIEIEWKYNTSLFNPLTWRILSTPKIYLNKVTVESLELDQRITVCPRNQKPLINGIPQLMIRSYC